MKTLKRIGLAIAILIILLAIILVLPIEFSLDSYKQNIIEQVEKATGRKFDIKGEVDISPGLDTSISLKGVTLGNPKGFSQQPMLNAETIIVHAKLEPLLQGDIVISSVEAKNAKIYLHNRNGRNNWTFTQDAKDGSKKDTDQSDNTASNLKISEIKLDKSQVFYNKKKVNVTSLKLGFDDEMENVKSTLIAKYNDVNFQLNSKIKLKSPTVDYQLNLALRDSQISVNGNAKLSQAFPSMNANIKMRGSSLYSFGKIFDFKPPKTNTFTAQAIMKNSGQKFNISGIKLEAFDGTVQGDATLDFSQKIPSYRFNLATRDLNAGQVFKNFNLTDKVNGGKLNADTNLNMRGNNATQLIGSLTGTANIFTRNMQYQVAKANIGTKFVKLLAGSDNASNISIQCSSNFLELKNGVAQNQLTVIDTKSATVIGKGTIQLNSGALNYSLTAHGKGVSLAHLFIPMYITGSIGKPVFVPNPVAITSSTINKVFNIATLQVFQEKTEPCKLTPQDVKGSKFKLPDFSQASKIITKPVDWLEKAKDSIF